MVDYDILNFKFSEKYSFNLDINDINYTPIIEYGDSYFILTSHIENVKSFNELKLELIGILSSRYIIPTYRISRNNINWSDYFEMNLQDENQSIIQFDNGDFIENFNLNTFVYNINNFPPFDPRDKLYIEIRLERKGNKSDGVIQVLSHEIIGDLDIEYNTLSGDEYVYLSSGESKIIKNDDIYKVFKINDIEVISSNNDSLSIKYRFSQDNKRTWSEWEKFTKENITTVRINPIRFFNIEYLVENIGNTTLKLNDINLIGDFQNVTKDSLKTNLYGIRQCCMSNLIAQSQNGNAGSIDENGNFNPNTNGYLNGGCNGVDAYKPMTSDQLSTLYNPYSQTQATSFLNQLNADAVEVFGHRVEYFVTDPDGNGIDYTIHEYGLFNIVCMGDVKVTVTDNQFQDSTNMGMNIFDLSLVDAFEIQISKEQFKNAFGVHRRPSKEDFLFFCDINMLYTVTYAQAFRSFNNQSLYYRVILTKYNKSASNKSANTSIENRIKELTNNSDMDSLFDVEKREDIKTNSNKVQRRVLTEDPIRVSVLNVDINRIIEKETIHNSNNIIARNVYNLSNAIIGGKFNNVSTVIEYQNFKNIVKVSDNISYTSWFNINNFIDDDIYTLYSHVEDDYGISITHTNNTFNIKLNNNTYTINEGIYEEVWYSILINIDNRDNLMDFYLYKRNVDLDEESIAQYLSSQELKLVKHQSFNIEPIEFEIKNNPKILLSDMKITNIRLFDDIIPLDKHNFILNLEIISEDTKHLIFGDNANNKLTLNKYIDSSQSY